MKLNDNSLFRQQAYVNGNWIDADDGKTFEVTNPATNEVIGTVPDLGAAETKRAIEAANEAWPAWRAKTAAERSAILETWFNLIMENQADLAALMTLEQGKSIAESTGEVAYGASFIKWFAEECKRVYGDTIPSKNTDQRIVVTKEPIGVCAAITPWNFPNAMITRKAAPAFGAGCPMVVKPAEATPFSALALAELAERAGIPAGIFSVVTASQGKDVGEEMTTNPIVRKVTFTGSTAVGKILMKQCSSTLKKMSLELGGNAPFIVFEDADLDAAVEGLMVSKYRNSGQTCVCTNRTIVHESVYDEFAAKLAAKVGELKVGDGFEEGVNQGPLINMAAVEKVEDHISDAVEKGAKVLVGGKRHELGKTFFEPTLLANVTTDMKVTYEETFGPVAPLFSFKTEAEAIQMANDTEFGLAAYFFSRDIGRSWRVSEALEYGMVGVNSGLISTEVAPFGGVKESGLGREGSKFGLDEYLETKYICMAGVSS
ncbi:NADP-dependent succinate-semialdehyde dehydrogenase [Cocleimonas flava]|uniref:Succinate semialdehyde dehydrogenase n=1 Tax=Cocleimonas flava TaxID=634765 RepID=A0A4V2P867_9GAMM|nr:NAD-dependent succinate-semialdehyde dehydrogenase [Cocleimonas flava]TCJ84475.1 succinate semialdehyde dehydrogenase [Cocleimonas flava]